MTIARLSRPQVGDKAWAVEWCVALALDEHGDVNHDKCVMDIQYVASKAAAEKLAREVFTRTRETFGIVTYWPVAFVPFDEDEGERCPHVGYWDATRDDVEEYSGK